jgi:hypothetical protein
MSPIIGSAVERDRRRKPRFPPHFAAFVEPPRA